MSTQPTQTQALAVRPETSPLITELAHDWKLSPATMLSTLKATIFPQKDRNDKPVVVTNEQMVAFLQVCHTYHLNPFVREIYAFPTKGGGIVPMVPIDGWSNIINRNPQMDGIEYEDAWETDSQTSKRSLFSTTCIIYRKDRSHPVRVTEYMPECFQAGKEPWVKWPARMLRHKATIQCARIAFSLAGIFDPDEAERIAEVGGDEKQVISRPTRASAAPAIDAPVSTTVVQAAVSTPTTGEASKGGSTAQHQPASASSECLCLCCKSGNCVCSSREDEFDRCGCAQCKFNTAAPPAEVKKEEPRPTSAAADSPTQSPSDAAHGSQPSSEELFGPQPRQGKAKLEGPYVENKARTKLIIAAKAVGWNVQKDSHDDQLHKFLKEKYGIESLTEIPTSLFDQILKEVGNSGAVKMNLK